MIKILINNIYKLHEFILNDKPTLDYMKNLRNRTICISDKKDILTITKQIYKTIYFALTNLYEFCKIFNYKLLIEDKKYIQSIIDKQDLDMTEVRTKTELALKNKCDLYSGVVKWIAGNTWSNGLITNGYESELLDIDKEIINSINESIELVEPINKSLILFHGFEKLSNYNEDRFKIGYKFNYKGILSKSSKFDIAKQFALAENYLQPKYLIVFYPPGSKHIELGIKPEKYDEYEYIGKQNEHFEIIKICKVFDGLKLQIFYICKSLDSDLFN